MPLLEYGYWATKECNDLDDGHAAYSYSDVLRMVCKLANALKAEGVQKGDRLSVYLPMILGFAGLALGLGFRV